MNSPRVSFWLATLAAGLLAVSSQRAQTDNSINSQSDAENPVFRFNVSPNGYPPYLMHENNGRTGIMWDVVEEIAGRIGYRVEAVRVPRKRVDKLLLKGMFDGTSRAKEWTDNPEDFIFTDPVVDIEEVIFFPKDSSEEFQVIEDLFSLTLITRLGYHYPELDSHFESGQIQRFDVSRDQDIFVYLLSSDELDAAVADRLVGQWLLLEQGSRDKFRVSSSTLSQSGFRLMLRPDWQSFAKAFNQELASMRETGKLDTILSKYR